MAQGQAGARRGNTNRVGKTKERPRIQVSMSISDHSEISDGVYADLRKRFEDYFLAQGITPSEEDIKKVARDWAYAAWWHNLKRAEDERAIVV